MASCEMVNTVKLTDLWMGEEPSSAQEPEKPTRPCLEIHCERSDRVELSLQCALEAADQLHEFLAGCFADLQEDVRESVNTALRELVLNAIEWGGKSDITKRVRVVILRTQGAVICRVIDPGEGFRREELSHAAVSNPDNRPYDHMTVREQKGLRPGGFGLAIVRGSVDHLIYNDVGNEVAFLKYIDSPSATGISRSSL